MNAQDTIRVFIRDNLFMGDDFLVVRAQDQYGNFFCVKISPITNKKQERGLSFEKYTCDDIRTLNDFVEKKEEFNADLHFLKDLNVIVVQFQRDGLKPIVIFGEWENLQDENMDENQTNSEDYDENEKQENGEEESKSYNQNQTELEDFDENEKQENGEESEDF